jgi:hypothetical protein
VYNSPFYLIRQLAQAEETQREMLNYVKTLQKQVAPSDEIDPIGKHRVLTDERNPPGEA